MKIVNEALLDLFRKPICEFCGKLVCATDPAHVFARGRSGAFRLDIPENLVGLCRFCHRSNHDGNRPDRQQLLWLVGDREKLCYDDLHDWLQSMRFQ